MNTENNLHLLAFLKGILYTMFVFLEINTSVFSILVVFMVLDSVSGVAKILKIDKKQFSFKKLLWGVVSKIGLLIVPLVVALLFKGIGQPAPVEGEAAVSGLGMGFAVESIMKILIVSEFISFLGNIYTVKTNIEVKDIDIFSMLFKFVRCKALKILGGYMGTELIDSECKKKKEAKEAEAKDEAEPKDEEKNNFKA